MNDQTIQDFADSFFRIFYDRQPGQIPSSPIESLSLDEAYRVQRSVVQMKTDNGERVVGYKIGCTSKAIREQFGLQNPIYGRLLEPHLYKDKQEISLDKFTSCALEPEFVFHIGSDLCDPTITDDALIAAVDHVSAGLEIHNYKFWFGEPTSQELIASNGIHAGLVVGNDRVPLSSLDLARTELTLLIDDQLVVRGHATEIMDSGPLLSLRYLIKHLADKGECLQAGELVIPGSPVKLVHVGPGSVARSVIVGVGSVEASFR